MRRVLVGLLIVAGFFGGTLWVLDTFFPADTISAERPALTALPPLKPVAINSTIVAPVAVANLAIREAMEAQAPRALNGTRNNSLGDLLGKADIAWNVARGPLAVSGADSALKISTALNGTLRVTAQNADKTGKVTDAIAGLLGESAGREANKLATRALDQRATIRGHVTVTAKPVLRPDWRIESNLAGQVAIANGGIAIAGLKLNVANEVKPLLDRTVNEELAGLSERLRNDRSLERAARREWAKICGSFPLAAAAAGAPDLWLELRPTQAFAAQPRIEADWVIFTLGVQAETRIVPKPTKFDCPLPQRLELVPQPDRGKISIALPIDLPLGSLSRLLEKELKGKRFPADDQAAGQVTVLAAQLAASGQRLLVSLRVKANENSRWIGGGAEVTVYIWGKPELDRNNQTIRLADISLDVQSEAAFGLLGIAARAAMPALQSALAQHALVDLKPFIAGAKRNIEAALLAFPQPADGVEVEAAITGLRMVDVAFDSATLRVTAEAEGTVRAVVRKIALQ